MEEKDYIYIKDSNGKKIKMELVLAMNSVDGKFQYIAYKEENKKIPLYLAKIYTDGNKTRLDTDLQEEEKQMLIKTIKQKIIGGKNE